MPAQGIVSIEISPLNARSVAWWLRTYHQPTNYQGILGEYLWVYRDHRDIDGLAKKFEKLVARKRVAPSHANVVVQLTRADAVWFAKRVRPRSGIFGRRPKPFLPEAVTWVSYRCLDATTKRRGRRLLADDRLRAAVGREHLDERHRKRLKRRLREEMAGHRGAAQLGEEIARAVTGAKST